MKVNFLSAKFSNGIVHFSLLILRVGIGLMLLTHGWDKLMNFRQMSAHFADPFHTGMQFSLGLTVFAEVVCSLFVILGLFTRLFTIPVIIQMIVILTMIHIHQGFGRQELAFHYLLVFTVILFCGPGRYSVDVLMRR